MKRMGGLVVAAVVTIQAISALAFYPYYYTYYNPLMEALRPGRQDPNRGYGEGLELAAAYLAAEPNPQEMTITAWYGRGPFSYFFPGETEPLKGVYQDPENVPQLIETLRRSNYLVIYYAHQKIRNLPANVMAALEGIAPEHVIWLNGIEYVRIYRVEDLPPSFYASLGR